MGGGATQVDLLEIFKVSVQKNVKNGQKSIGIVLTLDTYMLVIHNWV
jgi:hypothetical protein